MLVADCGGGASPSPSPVADAGADQTVFAGVQVTLDGSRSSDEAGAAISYRWSLAAPPGSAAALSSAVVAAPTFTPDLPGIYTVMLTVNDGETSSAPDRVDVDVLKSPWSMGATMPTPRTGFAVVAIGGRAYVVGGSIGSMPVGTVEIFDTSSNTWSAAPSLPVPRVGLAAAVANGKVYAIGGGPETVGGPVPTVNEFDPATGVWTEKAPMPTSRTAAAAAPIGNEIFVIGGLQSPTCRDWVCKGLATVESYDATLDAWTPRAALPRGGRIGPAAAVVGSTLYALGGEGQDGITIGAVKKDVFRYDVAAGSWSPVAPMPNALSGPVVAASGGRLIAASTPPMAYAPSADSWTVGTAPFPSDSFQAAVAIDGRIYVFSPTGTHVYDPTLDRP